MNRYKIVMLEQNKLSIEIGDLTLPNHPNKINEGELGIAFVILKLTGYITWSWWYVTLPFWGGIALVVLIALIVFAIALIFKSKY